jgi:ribonuclease III
MSLEDVLGYRFSDTSLLNLALTHRSISSDDASVPDNERLEFLGDAVLQLAVTNKIYHGYPDLPEGQLAKARAAVVSGKTLSEVASRVGLGSHVSLSPAEERSGGRMKVSILADTMEAIIGAVYLDAGLDVATAMIYRLFDDVIAEKAANPGVRDYKTRLQEVLATQGKRPEYQVSGEGPDHARTFTAVVIVDGRTLGSGAGHSKKEAEQTAAEAALDRLR